MVMKSAIIFPAMACAAVLLACSCENELITDVDYYVTVDKSTTFRAGEPVKFVLHGEADNYMFYSGETGHEFRYKDRTVVALEDVRSAKMTLECMPERYGCKGDIMSFWLSKTFDGLTGDRETDIAIMDAEVASGMAQWERLDWTEGPDNTTTSSEFDISDYLSHFCIAIHYNPSHLNPTTGVAQTQGTFNMSGYLDMDVEGVAHRHFSFGDMARVSVFMNRDSEGRMYEVSQGGYGWYVYTYYADRNDVHGYITDETPANHTRNGGVAFGWSQGDIRFTGSSAGYHVFDTDIWVVYTPIQLNTVEKDSGEVVKNLQNDLYEYEYTYSEAGYYKATFQGFNVTPDRREEKLVEIPIIISD